jgi:hypothetical protein
VFICGFKFLFFPRTTITPEAPRAPYAQSICETTKRFFFSLAVRKKFNHEGTKHTKNSTKRKTQSTPFVLFFVRFVPLWLNFFAAKDEIFVNSADALARPQATHNLAVTRKRCSFFRFSLPARLAVS